MTGLIGAGGMGWLALTLLILGLVLGLMVGLLLLLSVARRRRRRPRSPGSGPGGPASPEPPKDFVVQDESGRGYLQIQGVGPLPGVSTRPLTASSATFEAAGDEPLAVSGFRFRDEPVEQVLVQALEHLHDEPRDEYNALIDRLRTHAGEAAQAVASIEERLDDSGEALHSFRWSLYYILADVGLPDSISLLVDKATADLPAGPEDPEGEACEGPNDDAALVSVMAVEGIERLLINDAGRAEAFGALRHIVAHQAHPAVRRAAARALLTDPDQQHRDEFRSAIPSDLADLLQASHLTPQELADQLTIDLREAPLPPGPPPPPP